MKKMLLLFALIACALSQSNPPPKYYSFAVKRGWVSNECTWTIHGLWPEYAPNAWPQFCQPSRYGEYNENLLVQWFPTIQTVWPPKTIWLHEWMKHGTCTKMTLTEYFGKAIDLFGNLPTNCCNYTDPDCKSQQCLIKYDLNFNFISC